MASQYSYSSSESEAEFHQGGKPFRLKIKLNKGNGNIVDNPSRKGMKTSSLKSKEDREKDFTRKWEENSSNKMSSLKSKKDREKGFMHKWQQNPTTKGKGSGANDISSIKKQLESIKDTAEDDGFIENLDWEPRKNAKKVSGPRKNNKQENKKQKGYGVKISVNSESDSDIEVLPDLPGWDSDDQSKDVYR